MNGVLDEIGRSTLPSKFAQCGIGLRISDRSTSQDVVADQVAKLGLIQGRARPGGQTKCFDATTSSESFNFILGCERRSFFCAGTALGLKDRLGKHSVN
jgi:hypothetical protein